MDTEKTGNFLSASIFLGIWLLLSACGGNNGGVSSSTLPATVPTETAFLPLPIVLTPTPICNEGLTFLSDLTIPDFSVAAPGSRLDKQWLVQNTGSCNWNSHYRLRLVGGDSLGVPDEQALFPARAGMQATLQIIFTAPREPGDYFSEWQAYNGQGFPFGESFFIKIIVQ